MQLWMCYLRAARRAPEQCALRSGSTGGRVPVGSELDIFDQQACVAERSNLQNMNCEQCYACTLDLGVGRTFLGEGPRRKGSRRLRASWRRRNRQRSRLCNNKSKHGPAWNVVKRSAVSVDEILRSTTATFAEWFFEENMNAWSWKNVRLFLTELLLLEQNIVKRTKQLVFVIAKKQYWLSL